VRRREFITLVGGAAGAWPVAARAQQRPDRKRRIGVLMFSADDDAEVRVWVSSFVQGLRELNWAEGSNVHIDYRWTAGDPGRTRMLAAELVALKPDVILASNTTTLVALYEATRTTPIVFANVSDPVGGGFVQSFARPAGNITGFVPAEASLGGKWLTLLKEIAPGTKRVAFIFNPETAPYAEGFARSATSAASSFAAEVIQTPVHDDSEIERGIAALAGEPNGGLIVLPSLFTVARRAPIISLAARHRLPAIYAYRYFVTEGGLMSYGNDMPDQFHQAATYVDRILKGGKPSDLPIQAPTKFQFVINRRTAKTLGLDIPSSLLGIADEVIE
jgi:putative tryptophan/tyrosine transport system substrate-binding protein